MIKYLIILCLLCSPAAGTELIYFAPQDDCEAKVIYCLDKAKRTIHYQMYTFTSLPVADALIRAKKRGVDVTIVVDYRQSKLPSCKAAYCKAAGIPVYTDGKHPIAHNKIRLVDEKVAIYGSYNDTKQAHRNAENLYLTNHKMIVGKLTANFKEHLEHAKLY